jgi:hypothetical protein
MDIKNAQATVSRYRELLAEIPSRIALAEKVMVGDQAYAPAKIAERIAERRQKELARIGAELIAAERVLTEDARTLFIEMQKARLPQFHSTSTFSQADGRFADERAFRFVMECAHRDDIGALEVEMEAARAFGGDLPTRYAEWARLLFHSPKPEVTARVAKLVSDQDALTGATEYRAAIHNTKALLARVTEHRDTFDRNPDLLRKPGSFQEWQGQVQARGLAD